MPGHGDQAAAGPGGGGCRCAHQAMQPGLRATRCVWTESCVTCGTVQPCTTTVVCIGGLTPPPLRLKLPSPVKAVRMACCGLGTLQPAMHYVQWPWHDDGCVIMVITSMPG